MLKSFDRVAHVYDETRGLPPDVAATIAQALLSVFRVVAPRPRIVEVGIGTGGFTDQGEDGVHVSRVDLVGDLDVAVGCASEGDGAV